MRHIQVHTSAQQKPINAKIKHSPETRLNLYPLYGLRVAIPCLGPSFVLFSLRRDYPLRTITPSNYIQQ
ncbi:hypothetical protein P170DRAFT_433031 [Aspergillus steynii IBT 23096]|uniref:Uncharacterized protein n=1 Tax=Aspergillus steynii IBT 23096 TaxID=1392250 RepID=A0A2I2GRJ6_9EURO|nr:uncharacterized protein P170DRAFT_433031 [Aspergillus steynii IBT 23096]PLB55505.1 hypothetical protein P170DRAFT_433031 [Aspergillus steynii IBT 23096]